jgi:alpha-galactosidase
MKHTQNGKLDVSPIAGAVLAGLMLMLVTANGATGAEKASPKKDEMKVMDQWVQEHLTDAKAKLPFSFVYDGKASEGLLAEWPRRLETNKLDAVRSQYILTWTDPNTGLEVRCVAVTYRDFPTVEWTLYFKNTGAKDSPIISRIQALDTTFRKSEQGAFLLHHNVGSPANGSDYGPLVTPLAAGARKKIGAAGGRPTNSDLSYFNLEWSSSEGMIVVVGWPGQWAAEFVRDNGDNIAITAGQELTHFKLLPGEEVRSPLMVLQYWKGGDWIRAQNVWRRWMFAYNVPRPGGKLPPVQFLGCSSRAYNEMCGANEENQIMHIRRYQEERIKLDYWWMDAGWYKGGASGWGNVGTWETDPTRFPQGFKPISDYAHANGSKILVWFEPERVSGGSWIAANHPEWVLGGSLLNLGHPEALKWLVNHIDKLITDNGIDLYRQDFNMDPLGAWRANDAPDRQGITENKHVMGYLAYWDELRKRHPNLLIDSCASGGRRNDLETMRRAVPMWRSDNAFNQINNQSMTCGISLWIPFQGTGSVMARNAPYYGGGFTEVDPYCFWSDTGPSLNSGIDMRVKEINYDLLRKLLEQWRRMSPNYYGDFYPLTPWTLDANAWIAWQFDRPEQHKGVLQVFRRDNAPAGEMRIKLRGLDADATYELNDFDKAVPTNASGRELMETGLLVTLPPRAAAVIVYSVMSAVASADCTAGEIPLTVRFDGKQSTSASGKIASYEWDFGDGATARGDAVSHTYAKTGTFTARLTVRDGQGHTETDSVTVQVAPVDDTAPTLLDVKPVRSDRVILTFSEPVQQADAETISNYTIIPDVHVLTASLGTDRKTVTLTIAPLPEGEYTLKVKNIRDCARKPNMIAANTSKAFRYSLLFARWKLDEEKNLVAADAGLSKLDGALKGGVTWTNAAGRKALSFDGAGGIVEIPTRLEDLAVPFSFTLWVNPAAEQMEYADIFGNHGGSGVGLVMQQDQNKTNLFGFGYGDGKQWQESGTVQLTAGQWQHVAVVCDGSKAFFFVNGEVKSSAAAAGVFAPNLNLTFRLGQGYGEKRFFKGLLSDVRIYRTALSPAEVQAVMKE